MPPSYPLGDVTSLLSVKVRPRLNKGLNHCLFFQVRDRWRSAAEAMQAIDEMNTPRKHLPRAAGADQAGGGHGDKSGGKSGEYAGYWPATSSLIAASVAPAARAR